MRGFLCEYFIQGFGARTPDYALALQQPSCSHAVYLSLLVWYSIAVHCIKSGSADKSFVSDDAYPAFGGSSCMCAKRGH